MRHKHGANGIRHASGKKEQNMEHTTESNTSKQEDKQPFYLIGEQSARIVLELVETSKKLYLGNVGFQLSQPIRADFLAKDSRDGWELTVSTGYGNSKRDVYKITEDGLVFIYSESDGDS